MSSEYFFSIKNYYFNITLLIYKQKEKNEIKIVLKYVLAARSVRGCCVAGEFNKDPERFRYLIIVFNYVSDMKIVQRTHNNVFFHFSLA